MMIRHMLSRALLLGLVFPASAQTALILRRGEGEVSFVARRFGLPTSTGRFDRVDGTVSLDFERPERSRIRVTLDTASLRTGAALVDGFIKGESMLDVARYPAATFVSEGVTRTGERSLVIHGQLTIRAISRPVNVVAIAYGDPARLGRGGRLPFHATTAFSRAAFAIGRDVNVVDDEVEIQIRGEVSR